MYNTTSDIRLLVEGVPAMPSSTINLDATIEAGEPEPIDSLSIIHLGEHLELTSARVYSFAWLGR